MTKEELLVKLQKLKQEEEDRGCDCTHGDADKALIDYINDEDIKTAYKALKKWYA
jgi:hypothetical protein